MIQGTLSPAHAIPLERECISCQICGRQNTQALFWKTDRFKIDARPFAVVRCPDCDYFYVNPRPFPGDLLKFYPDTYAFQEEAPAAGGVGRWLKKAEALYRDQGLSHDVGRLLAVTKKTSGCVLEIGCGTGDRLRLLKQKGYETLGLEPAAAAREYGRKHFGLRIEAAALENWPGPGEGQDVICIYNVLEHLPYPVAQLKRLASWLAPEGALVIQIPNAASLQARWLHSRWCAVDVPRDLFYFTPCALQAAARQAGLECFKIEYGHHWMHPPTLVSSLFPALDPAVIWSEEGHRPSTLKKILWAFATLLAVPVAFTERLFGQSTVMTLYLKAGRHRP